MQTEAGNELQSLKQTLVDIGRDVALFEQSEPPHDTTGLACLRQRIGLAKDALPLKLGHPTS